MSESCLLSKCKTCENRIKSCPRDEAFSGSVRIPAECNSQSDANWSHISLTLRETVIGSVLHLNKWFVREKHTHWGFTQILCSRNNSHYLFTYKNSVPFNIFKESMLVDLHHHNHPHVFTQQKKGGEIVNLKKAKAAYAIRWTDTAVKTEHLKCSWVLAEEQKVCVRWMIGPEALSVCKCLQT